MKKIFASTVVVCLGLLAGVGIAPAQMVNVLKVTLPSAVTVGSITLPAGDCTIQTLQSDGNSSVLLIRANNGVSVDAIANHILPSKTESANETRLILRNTGSTYQLDKIWLAGQQYGYDIVSAK